MVLAADYAPKNAFFFPGQGAQSVGMAKELCEECPAAKELFDKASEILGAYRTVSKPTRPWLLREMRTDDRTSRIRC